MASLPGQKGSKKNRKEPANQNEKNKPRQKGTKPPSKLQRGNKAQASSKNAAQLKNSNSKKFVGDNSSMDASMVKQKSVGFGGTTVHDAPNAGNVDNASTKNIRKEVAEEFKYLLESSSYRFRDIGIGTFKRQHSRPKLIRQASVSKSKQVKENLLKKNLFGYDEETLNMLKKATHPDRGFESDEDESRFLNLPLVAAELNTAWERSEKLKPFDLVLGGGAALTDRLLAKKKLGRLGHPSDNIRDLDFEIQLKQASHKKGQFKNIERKHEDVKTFLEKELKPEIDKMLENQEPFKSLYESRFGEPPEVEVTDRHTLIYKYPATDTHEEFEFSFYLHPWNWNVNHQDPYQREPFTYESNAADNKKDSEHKYKVLDSTSHWETTTRTLDFRLKKKNKVMKTLMDTLAQLHNESTTRSDYATRLAKVRDVLEGPLGNNAKMQEIFTGLGNDFQIQDLSKAASQKLQANFQNQNDEKLTEQDKYKFIINTLLTDIKEQAAPYGRTDIIEAIEDVEFVLWKNYHA